MCERGDNPKWRQADPVGEYAKCRKVLAELGMADASGTINLLSKNKKNKNIFAVNNYLKKAYC